MRGYLMRGLTLGLLMLSVSGAGCKNTQQSTTPTFEIEFLQSDSLDRLVFTDAKAWTWSMEGDVPSLELKGGSEYQPPHRSPLNIALIEDVVLGDFTLELDMLQTGREYGHRDLCLFFGFQSPDKYYYVHMATTPDPNAHNVFLVNEAPRRPLAPVAEVGVDWGTDVWHRVRLEREVESGAIRVFFDDMETPVIEAVDTTFGAGRIGFGSFDDSGRFARVRIEGEAAEGPVAPDWDRIGGE